MGEADYEVEIDKSEAKQMTISFQAEGHKVQEEDK